MTLEVRTARKEDEQYLLSWFLDEPEILKWFPMQTDFEIRNSIKIWMGYGKYDAALMVLSEGIPCGSAVLYLPLFQKFSHHALFGIFVKKEYRGKGVGSFLLEKLIEVARKRFNFKILYLEVYRGNPAISLYRRFGFEEYGVQRRFLKEEDGTYSDKVLMQKYLR